VTAYDPRAGHIVVVSSATTKYLISVGCGFQASEQSSCIYAQRRCQQQHSNDVLIAQVDFSAQICADRIFRAIFARLRNQNDFG
jgi:hypothetical protein